MPLLVEQIKALAAQKNAVILAHTYQPAQVQDLADYVGDSYGLSVEATRTRASTIIFCGVMFMAETAAILNSDKTVIIPAPGAGCPMADMITAEDLVRLKAEHPDHLVMCYVNSTAEIKALSDICCTSSNAVKIVNKIPKSQGIIFIPDKHLGTWVEEQCGRHMVLWNGFCPTHATMKIENVQRLKTLHPQALVLMHPEVPAEVRTAADRILSTGGMCDLVGRDAHDEFIIATEMGILHTLRKHNPQKTFYPVSPDAVCPNMKKTTLDLVFKSLEGSAGARVLVDKAIAEKAYASLKKMLDMSV